MLLQCIGKVSSYFLAYLVVRSLDVECSIHFLTVLAAAYRDNKLLYALYLEHKIKCATTANMLIITDDMGTSWHSIIVPIMTNQPTEMIG